MKTEVRKAAVSCGDFSMDYFTFGRGAQTLVILPGLSVQSVVLSADAVAQAYAPLAEDFALYVFDRRKELPPEYRISDMARDTAAAIKALGLCDVCLFGVSQGGMIAMTIAATNPSLVRKLALGSTAARVEEAVGQTVEQWVALAQAGDAQGLYCAFGKALYPPKTFAQVSPLLASLAEKVTKEELRRFVLLARALYGFDVTADLPKIACPVLVIGSADDRVVGPRAFAEILACFVGREDICSHLYEGFGHAAYDLAPDYKERLRQFLLKTG